MNYDAIVLAAGSAARSNLGFNKIFYMIDGTPMIILSTRNFINDKDCKKIIVVCKKEEEGLLKSFYNGVFKIEFVTGGNTRQESVKNALPLVSQDYVLIHDAARPFYSTYLLDRLKKELSIYDSVIPVIELKDTIKEVKDGLVIKTLTRNALRIVQTPQAFKTSIIKQAHEKAINNSYLDDSSMVDELLGVQTKVVEGEIKNNKFTFKEDFENEEVG